MVAIIYNPHSTSGQAEQKAFRLASRLQKRSQTPVQLRATEYAGHAETIAYDTVREHHKPLLVSVSGDGGYNEVINGAMRAQTADGRHQPVCAILPAGNANDHRRNVRRRPLSWAILRTDPEAIDILQLHFTTGHQLTTRYAHSYIGLGFTSQAAVLLNQHNLTRWIEFRLVLKAIFHVHPTTIYTPDSGPQKLDSLVFTNIQQMSKVLKVGRKTNLRDGLFRVFAIPQRGPLRLFFTLLRVVLFGVKRPPQQAFFKFTIPHTELVHLDGEVMTLPGGSQVEIRVAKQALLTVR